ncbi:hypothetical protein [Streptomyces boncukensis]|uniref:Uncharacterized protein n=1 Tax=Streptomyces boncukensis TaxID=2711219 RepID=A0A6G4X3J8_9ACTN|nr:hypothetical protein [Streptomyces boncukensis]NGO71460.1 hypothetical protein [Streptomyces boncukensis]
MRDLIACLHPLLRLLLPQPRPGRHTAAYLANPAPTRPAPAQPAKSQPRPVPDHVRERMHPLDAEAVAPIRPYLIAHEHRVERRRQRERRTAAALATLGIDYDPNLAVAVGA